MLTSSRNLYVSEALKKVSLTKIARDETLFSFVYDESLYKT